MPKLEGMIGKEMLEEEVRTLIDYANPKEWYCSKDATYEIEDGKCEYRKEADDLQDRYG